MIRVAPAILEQNFKELAERFRSVSGLVPFVQVDICDGKFVPSKTFGSDAKEESFKKLNKLTKEYKLDIELDMMVRLDADTDNMFDKWMSAIKLSGAKSVVLHYGSTESKWSEIFKALDNGELMIGLSIHIDTPLGDAINLLNKHNFKYVQVMGIEKVGYGGQSFTDKTLGIIEDIHKELPNILVSVDGGINLNTVDNLKRAGVQQLVAGSAIFNASNKGEIIRLLQA